MWAAAAKRDEAERALTQSKEVTHALREAAIEVEAQRREEAAEMARVAKTQREKQQAERKQQQLQAAAEAVSWKVLVHEIGFGECHKAIAFRGAKDYPGAKVQELHTGWMEPRPHLPIVVLPSRGAAQRESACAVVWRGRSLYITPGAHAERVKSEGGERRERGALVAFLALCS